MWSPVYGILLTFRIIPYLVPSYDNQTLEEKHIGEVGAQFLCTHSSVETCLYSVTERENSR